MNPLQSFQQIINGGYCIGCGVCAAVSPQQISMGFSPIGTYQPEIHNPNDLSPEELRRLLEICPFSDNGLNEDGLAERLFPETNKDSRVGRFIDIYVGHATEGDFHARGSSGGMVSWLLAELLRAGHVDAILHVGEAEPGAGVIFQFAVSRTPEQVLSRSKSRYYPIELSQVLDFVRHNPGRYALVGIPCFIKAVRRLMLGDVLFKDRIAFCIGLVCGHLKSKGFAESIASEAGISPHDLEGVDFRVSLPDRKPWDYGISLRGRSQTVTRPAREFLTTDWGLGLFKYSACEFCDDVFAETADIAFGDAWLPEFGSSGKGTSIVVVRSKQLQMILRSGMREERIALSDCSADKAAESQAGGLRHRRDGLSYRLYLKKMQHEWAPCKRVPASREGTSKGRAEIYRMREELRRQSHESWRAHRLEGGFAAFKRDLQPLLRRYRRLQRPLWRRVVLKLKAVIRRLLHR